MTSDEKPLTDNEADDRLKAALDVLGDARGETTAGHAALEAARKALVMLSMALIAAGVNRDQLRDPTIPD